MEIIKNQQLPERTKEKMTKEALMQKYNIQISTLNKILQNQETILEKSLTFSGSRKAVRLGEFPALEKALYEWFLTVRAKNLPVSGPFLIEKAVEFARKSGIEEEDFKGSPGWLSNFKSRYGLHAVKLAGESASANPEDVNKGWELVTEALKTYGEDNCYNADETGLYYRLQPDRSIVAKGDSGSGTKIPKERVTLLVCANASGTKKLRLWMVGKSENPRGMMKEKPMIYKANKKAWMTSEIFEQFTKELDKTCSCDTALILDNASVHGIASNLDLKHLKIIFLPPNTTSKTQPMDAGIIQALKLRYRKAMMTKVSWFSFLLLEALFKFLFFLK